MTPPKNRISEVQEISKRLDSQDRKKYSMKL